MMTLTLGGQIFQQIKVFSVRIIATDLRGNQLATTEKVYVDRVDCSETAMESITVYKTKAAMTIEDIFKVKVVKKYLDVKQFLLPAT